MKRTRKYLPSLGSISHGTLRAQDLFDAFLHEAKQRFPKHQTVKDALEAALDTVTEYGDDETVRYSVHYSENFAELVNELQELLDTELHPFWHFGSHEGDGSDFGYWVNHWSLGDACSDGEVIATQDLSHVKFARGKHPLRVDGTESDASYVAVVNCHGNTTLYTATGRFMWDCA